MSSFIIERDGLPYCEFKRFGSTVGQWGLVPRIIDHRGSNIHVVEYPSFEIAQSVINRSHVYFQGASIVEVESDETPLGIQIQER